MWIWTTVYFLFGLLLSGLVCWMGWSHASGSPGARRRHVLQCLVMAVVWLPALVLPPLRAAGAALRGRKTRR